MTSTVTCDYANAAWEQNAAGQNACQVYAALQGVCNPGFTIASVGSTSPPYVPQDNACGCNVVAYNLMGGCGWCQSQILTSWWLTEAQWAGNCTATTFDSTGIPSSVSTTNLAIPAWAFIIPSGTTWSPSQAQLAAASASPSNTLATVIPGATTIPDAATTQGNNGFSSINGNSNTRQTSTFTFFSGGDDSFVSTASNSGKVAGAVVGVILGLYALAAIIIVVVYFMRQNKRKAWYGPMAQYYAGMRNGGVGQPLMFNPNAATPYETTKTPMSGSSGGNGYAAYQPPPPEQPAYGYNNAAYGQQGYIQPDPTGTTHTSTAYGGMQPGPAPNTNSMYGAPNTNSMYGAPPNQPPPGTAGYKGYAEAH